MTERFIRPNWPAPENIKALSTLRKGGVSAPPYNDFNLATHVGDNPAHILANRQQLNVIAQLPESPRWLNQVHGIGVIDSQNWFENTDADGCFSTKHSHVCTVMTADCLPVLLCSKQGDFVAAVHAGWRGLLNGIIEQTIEQYAASPSDLIAWLGPAIGPEQFEVGTDVYNAFSNHSTETQTAFVQTDSSHYLANIYLLARQRLNSAGITNIFGGDYCTVSEPERFFSYRRDGITGRMASMIWIAHK